MPLGLLRVHRPGHSLSLGLLRIQWESGDFGERAELEGCWRACR